MTKRNYSVKVGRVCVINFGDDAGKICTIVDIVDQSRALVDGPTSGVKRQTMPYRWLSLTSISFDCPRGCSKAALTTKLEENKVMEQYAETNWAKKAARTAK